MTKLKGKEIINYGEKYLILHRDFIIICFLLDGKDCFNDSAFLSVGDNRPHHIQIGLVGRILHI